MTEEELAQWVLEFVQEQLRDSALRFKRRRDALYSELRGVMLDLYVCRKRLDRARRREGIRHKQVGRRIGQLYAGLFGSSARLRFDLHCDPVDPTPSYAVFSPVLKNYDGVYRDTQYMVSVARAPRSFYERCTTYVKGTLEREDQPERYKLPLRYRIPRMI